jgi:Putative metal-binding motif
MEEMKLNRATSILNRLIFTILAVLLLSAAPSTATAAVVTYPDLASFIAAAGGGELTYEGFDGFTSGTLINDQIPGVVFSSPNAGIDGYFAIQTLAHSAASSAPNMLVGGSVPGVGSPLQVMVLEFNPAITAFSFDLTAYLPAATPASVRFDFDNESSATLSLSNDSGSESTPVFFGALSDLAIVRVTITSGTENGGFEEFGIDDVRFGTGAPEIDTTPPVCSGAPATEGGVRGIDGTATDSGVILCIDCIAAVLPGSPRPGQFQSGIVSVLLQEGSSNVRLTVDSFESGASLVGFRVEPIDTGANGQGTVVATDGGGNTCTLHSTFRALGPGPLSNETICSADGLLLSVSNGGGTPAGAAACSANPPNGGEPPLPPGYLPSPPDDPFPCQVLTIDSPVSGSTDMTLKKDAPPEHPFEPDLRMLYSHSIDVGGVLTYPPFTDVTLSVDQIASVIPDPTRVRGAAQWSPVKVTCALLSEDARLSYCAGLGGGPGPDADGDGYTLCGSATQAADCSDQRASIHPGAAEVCNGLDDDCDGVADNGHPTEGAGAACTVVQTGLFGACTHGLTSCADGPMVCAQTVLPVQEVACNGVDDDCDGHVDEAYVFSGYLAPIKPDGSTVFLKKRGAIPIKFQLRDCAGTNVANAVARIEVHFVANGVVGDEAIDIGSTGGANTDNLYRYDPTAQQYIYNLSASSLQSNSLYVIRTILDDGTVHDVTIGIK